MKTVLPIAISIVVAASPVWAQQGGGNRPSNPTTSGSSPMVVNAAGQPVGRFIHNGHGSAGVIITYNGQSVALALNVMAENGMTWAMSQNPLFTSGNCTGQAYVPAGSSFTRLTGTAFMQGGQARAFIQSGNPQAITYQSSLGGDGNCYVGTDTLTAVPATPITLENPPLYLQ